MVRRGSTERSHAAVWGCFDGCTQQEVMLLLGLRHNSKIKNFRPGSLHPLRWMQDVARYGFGEIVWFLVTRVRDLCCLHVQVERRREKMKHHGFKILYYEHQALKMRSIPCLNAARL